MEMRSREVESTKQVGGIEIPEFESWKSDVTNYEESKLKVMK